MNALDRAVICLKGVGKLADAIGVGQTVVSNWRLRNTVPDPVYCVRIESATRGLVTVEELRPGAQWMRIPDANWPHEAGRPLLDLAQVAASAHG